MYLALYALNLEDVTTTKGAGEFLKHCVKGNWNGTEIEDIEAESPESPDFPFSKIFDNNDADDKSAYKSVSAVCTIPSEKSEDHISQGIDKLLNGMDNDEYTIVILAEPV
jgi:hypothetical protein